MALPSKAEMTIPFLEHIQDGRTYLMSDVVTHLAKKFNLTPAELIIVRPGSGTPKFNNTVHWLRFDMKESGLITAPKRGHIKITPKGIQTLSSSQTKIVVIDSNPTTQTKSKSTFEKMIDFVREFISVNVEAVWMKLEVYLKK